MDIDEVRRAIDLDEPNYPSLAAELGDEILPQLRTLVAEDDPRIASKAAYLASLLSADDSAGVVALASESRHPVVRLAAASALSELDTGSAVPLARRLLADPDPGVRVRTVRSASSVDSGDLQADLAQAVQQDSDDAVRSLATELPGSGDQVAPAAEASSGGSRPAQELLTRFRAALGPEIAEIQAKGRQYLAEMEPSTLTRLSIEIGVGDDPKTVEAANSSVDCWTEDVICGKSESGYIHCSVRVCMIIGPVTERPG